MNSRRLHIDVPESMPQWALIVLLHHLADSPHPIECDHTRSTVTRLVLIRHQEAA